MKAGKWVLLENRLAHWHEDKSFLFSDPVHEWQAFDSQDLMDCFAEMDQASQQGLYLVGYLAYEAYFYFSDKNRLPSAKPLLHFLACENLTKYSQHSLAKYCALSNDFQISKLKLMMCQEDYLRGFTKVREHIINGDSYQTNFTNKYQFQFSGDPWSLYQQLRARQKVAFGGFLQFEQYQILSCSPELFLQKTGDCLITKPMKGTMPRDEDPRIDGAYQAQLRQCEKLTAENLMIVDLLRNDLSLISKPGSVLVPKLLEVETYETLHQMTSTIQSTLCEELRFADIMAAMFPCGSVTGAPKKRTMEIIEAVESGPRGIYTGSIGYILPNQDFCFNVAIRSLVIEDNVGELGIGGGVVYDSTPMLEFAESKLKARFFLQALTTNMVLFESILYSQNQFYLLDEHLQRLKSSAQELGFIYSEQDIQLHLAAAVRHAQPCQDYKIRLLLTQNDKINVQKETIDIAAHCQKPMVGLCVSDCIDASHPLLTHKLLNSEVRLFYQSVRQQHPHLWDMIFVNEKQELTESSIGNIYIEQQGIGYTPPLDCGLLPGVMRSLLLKKQKLKEKVLTIDDLRHAQKIFIINSVRGIQEVSLCPRSY